MNMKKGFYFLVGLSLFLMASPAVEAQSTATDQMQPSVDITVGGLAIGDTSEEQLAQTVTVGLDGWLEGVFLPIGGCDSGRLIIEIRTLDGDSPSDVVLRRRRFNAADVPQVGPVFRLFRMGGWLSFSAGDRFAIVLRNPTGSCGIFQGPEGDSYAGGQGFFQALPNPPGWVPFSATETRLDLPFMTLMRLP